MKIDRFRKYPFTSSVFDKVASTIVNHDQDKFVPMVIDNNPGTNQDLPYSFKFVGLGEPENSSEEIVSLSVNLVNDIKDRYDLISPLMVYYPPGGFIDWHTNENAGMFNAICTYSHTGNSFFEYKNTEGTVIRVDDDPGWTVKVTYWGTEEPVPHRAVSNDHRISFALSSKQYEPVERFVVDLVSGTF